MRLLKPLCLFLITLAALPAAMPIASAAEGMWMLDRLPKAAMQQAYGFTPDARFVDQVMKSSVRLAGGCSGSFVSANGLVLTNYHCVARCVSQLSSADADLMASGLVAATHEQEMACPNIELNRLEKITDVTERIAKATEGLSGQAYADAKTAARAAIESECVGSAGATRRCDVVSLYRGGIEQLYQYTRFQDVRLAFVPEYASAFFGGDPDNFNFPRYNLDMALLRAYRDGKPAKVEHFLPIKPEGAQPGELVMVTGHPGSTQRLMTVAQLETQRDLSLISYLLYLAELRGLLSRYEDEGEEQARIVQADLLFVENRFKSGEGKLQALLNPAVFDLKRRQEAELREFVRADPQRQASYGKAWNAIARAQQAYRKIATRYNYIEAARGFMSDYFRIARTLVRGAEERGKPDSERLGEFNEAGLPRLEQLLFAKTPIYPEYEKLKLGFSLEKLREQLGADDPFVKLVLGKESPQALAARIIDSTTLGDIEVRRALWEGGATAVAQSTDPMIQLVRAIDPLARELRARYESEVEAVVDKNQALIAQARFAQRGTDAYPDATFTLRLSYGEVTGWDENGEPVAPFTDIAGLFARATGFEPYLLPPSWLDAKPRLNMETPLNFVASLDIIGGNSGSPIINRSAELVGLVFDGNIHSLGGAYWYDERSNRAIGVHSASLIEAMKTVYGATPLVDELLAR